MQKLRIQNSNVIPANRSRIKCGMTISLAVCAMLFGANLAFAQPVIPCLPDSSVPCISDAKQEQGGKAIRDYVLNIWGAGFISGFLGMVAIGCVIFIIVGGVQMLLAMGNEEDLGKAKKTVMWAIIGLVVAIMSVAIVQIISNLSF